MATEATTIIMTTAEATIIEATQIIQEIHLIHEVATVEIVVEIMVIVAVIEAVLALVAAMVVSVLVVEVASEVAMVDIADK